MIRMEEIIAIMKTLIVIKTLIESILTRGIGTEEADLDQDHVDVIPQTELIQ